MNTLLITHTHAEGTTITGTERGDGTAEVLKATGWRWSRTIGRWYIPSSRDRLSNPRTINRTIKALVATGFAVRTEIDETTRPVAQVEADKAERAQERADALANKADRKAVAADTAWAAHDQACADVPPDGQPILVGHHSERGHRNALARAHKAARTAINATDEATEVARRAAIAARTTEHRYSPVTVQNRIDKIAARLRRIDRALVIGRLEYIGPHPAPPSALTSPTVHPQWWRNVPPTEERAARLHDLKSDAEGPTRLLARGPRRPESRRGAGVRPPRRDERRPGQDPLRLDDRRTGQPEDRDRPDSPLMDRSRAVRPDHRGAAAIDDGRHRRSGCSHRWARATRTTSRHSSLAGSGLGYDHPTDALVWPYFMAYDRPMVRRSPDQPRPGRNPR